MSSLNNIQSKKACRSKPFCFFNNIWRDAIQYKCVHTSIFFSNSDGILSILRPRNHTFPWAYILNLNHPIKILKLKDASVWNSFYIYTPPLNQCVNQRWNELSLWKFTTLACLVWFHSPLCEYNFVEHLFFLNEWKSSSIWHCKSKFNSSIPSLRCRIRSINSSFRFSSRNSVWSCNE